MFEFQTQLLVYRALYVRKMPRTGCHVCINQSCNRSFFLFRSFPKIAFPFAISKNNSMLTELGTSSFPTWLTMYYYFIHLINLTLPKLPFFP